MAAQLFQQTFGRVVGAQGPVNAAAQVSAGADDAGYDYSGSIGQPPRVNLSRWIVSQSGNTQTVTIGGVDFEVASSLALMVIE